MSRTLLPMALFGAAVAPVMVLLGARAEERTIYSARCFHTGASSFNSCEVLLEQDSVRLSFGRERHQDEDVTISGQDIARVVSSFRSGAGPVSNARQQYSLRSDSNSILASVRVRIEDAPEFQQQLVQISRTYVTFSDARAEEDPHEARCLYIQLDDFKACNLTFGDGELAVDFDALEDAPKGNFTIVGDRVSGIASGNYARRLLTDTGGVVGSLILGPAVTVSRLAFSSESQEYVLEFTNAEGAKTGMVVRVRRSQAPQFQQELTQLTGKFINFTEPTTTTVIDVGPDIR